MAKPSRKQAERNAYWRAQVEKWRADGLSQAEYCRQAGVSAVCLGRWKRRFDKQRRNEQAPPLIVPVPLEHECASGVRHESIMVHACHGLRIEIKGDFHAHVLEKIVSALGLPGFFGPAET